MKRMQMVRITHPQVGETEVPASAVPHWTRAGWTVVQDVKVERPARKEGGK